MQFHCIIKGVYNIIILKKTDFYNNYIKENCKDNRNTDIIQSKKRKRELNWLFNHLCVKRCIIEYNKDLSIKVNKDQGINLYNYYNVEVVVGKRWFLRTYIPIPVGNAYAFLLIFFPLSGMFTTPFLSGVILQISNGSVPTMISLTLLVVFLSVSIGSIIFGVSHIKLYRRTVLYCYYIAFYNKKFFLYTEFSKKFNIAEERIKKDFNRIVKKKWIKNIKIAENGEGIETTIL